MTQDWFRMLLLLLGPLLVGCYPATRGTVQQSRSASEPPTILFWGIQRGCARDEALTDSVRRHLEQLGQPVVLVDREVMSRNPTCLGENCLRALRQSCPRCTGILLGGVVTQRLLDAPTGGQALWQLLRLWRAEVAHADTAAYLQQACRSCELPERIARMLAELIETPSGQVRTEHEVRATRPAFCRDEEAALPRATPSRRIALVVGGALPPGASRARIISALKEHLMHTGRDLVRPAAEASRALLPERVRLLATRADTEVLVVEPEAEGQIRLRHLEAITRASREANADCLGCDEEHVMRKIVQMAAQLLDGCEGGPCKSGYTSPLHLPSALCASLPDSLFVDCVSP